MLSKYDLVDFHESDLTRKILLLTALIEYRMESDLLLSDNLPDSFLAFESIVRPDSLVLGLPGNHQPTKDCENCAG